MAETDAPKKRRLNPFAFPSETNVRFSLLVVAAVALTYSIVQPLMPDPAPPDPPNLFDPSSVEQALMEWGQARAEYMTHLAVTVAFALIMLTLAAIVYRGHADRIRRNGNLRLLTGSDDPQFEGAVQAAVGLSGLSPAPNIEIDMGSRSVDGQAFGFRDHYSVRLGGRLRLLLRQNPGSFQAIVLHELAHISNADIPRTYFAQAIWIAFAILVVIPGTAYLAFSFIQGLAEKLSGGLTGEEWAHIFSLNVPTLVILLFQFVGSLVIAAAIYSSLLRIREIYADWRASLWGAEAALADILSRGGDAASAKTGKSTRLWQLHPTHQERLTMLQNPARLFRVTNELPFFVGALLGYALPGAFYFGFALLQILQASKVIGLMQFSKSLGSAPITVETLLMIFSVLSVVTVALMLALDLWVIYLVAGALGLEVQREALADLIAGRRGWTTYLSLWKPAGIAAIGFQLGSLLTPINSLGSLPELISTRGLKVLLITISLTAATALLTWLGLVYIRFFARRMLGLHTGTSSPQGARRLLTLVLSALLLPSYLPAMLGQPIVERVILNAALTVPFGNTTISQQTIEAQSLSFILGAALLQYIVAFGATWLIMRAYRLVWPPRCPNCKQRTRQRYAVGQICEHCSNELAPWLYVS